MSDTAAKETLDRFNGVAKRGTGTERSSSDVMGVGMLAAGMLADCHGKGRKSRHPDSYRWEEASASTSALSRGAVSALLSLCFVVGL